MAPKRAQRQLHHNTHDMTLGLQATTRLSLEQSSLLTHKMKPKASKFMGSSIEGAF